MRDDLKTRRANSRQAAEKRSREKTWKDRPASIMFTPICVCLCVSLTF